MLLAGQSHYNSSVHPTHARRARRTPCGSPAKRRKQCGAYGLRLLQCRRNLSIRTAIAEQGLTSVTAIGKCLKAGTGCGSCVPEIRKILTSLG
ncbi:MAG: (2Fe-2S)-binding protein [Gallionella sp.]|nr:(2Fe-2S)-binding protein [Gallionella sp.]